MSYHQPERAATTSSMIPRMMDSLRVLALAEGSEADRAKLKGKVAWFGDVLRIRGSTIMNVSKAVVVVTVWATVVAIADFVYGKQFNLSNAVVPLLSVVVGMMLVFRNTTAFARWDEGRKSFTALQSIVRNASRDYWISIGGPSPAPDSSIIPQDEVRTKARCLRLMVAFVVAVKRHVRGQYGIDYEDLRALLPPEFYNQTVTLGFGYDAANADVEVGEQPRPTFVSGLPPQSPELTLKSSSPAGSSIAEPSSLQAGLSATIPRADLLTKPSRRRTSVFSSQEDEWREANLPAPLSETSPLLRKSTSDHRLEDSTAVIVHNYLSKPSLPLPLVIAHQIHLYVAQCQQKGYLESIGSPGFGRLTQAVFTMTDLFGQIEALASLRIPACYGIHLKQCTTLYLFALPLTLASGIEALARECEDPFGMDPFDLPLDYICAELRNEVEHLIAKLGFNPDANIMF